MRLSNGADLVGAGSEVVSGSQDFGSLTPLLAPRSIAVVGASDREGNLGGRCVGFLRKFGFAGPVWPVNPSRAEVGGLACHPSLAALPGVPDLAILAMPAQGVVALVEEVVAAGIPAALAWAGGFAEGDEAGRALQRRLADTARDGGLSFCGPNCLGIINTGLGVTASFGSMLSELDQLRQGSISIVSQSGGIATMAHAKAEQLGFGFRVTVSCGNEAVLSVADFITALARDPGTRVIAVYCEGVQRPDDFIAALGEARSQGKPVVIMKGGASTAGERAALAHTGRLAGADQIFDAVVREFAAIRVHSLEEMLDVALTLATLEGCRLPQGNTLAITTFGGGSGVLATDQASREGLSVPVLTHATRETLQPLLTPLAALGNPVDLTPQSINDPTWRARLPEALDNIVADPGVESLLFLIGGLGHRSAELADIIEGIRRRSAKPVIPSWLFAPQRAIDDLARRGIFVFPEHARAARAVARLARQVESGRLRLSKVAVRNDFDWSPVADGVGARVASEPAVARLLAGAGLAVAEGELAGSPQQAAEIAERLGGRLAAKGISSDVPHRAAAGWVTLGLTTPGAVADADRRYRAAAAERGLSYDGTWVQRMVEGDRELLVTALRDPDFGVVVGVGIGGSLTEIIDDVTFARAPLSVEGAADLLGELRTLRRRPDFLDAGQSKATAAFVARFSELAASAPFERFTLEINPLKVGDTSARAVDGLLVIETLDSPADEKQSPNGVALVGGSAALPSD